MKITIQTNEVIDLTERELQILFSDALGEFVSARGPTAKEYVDRRYPNTENYAWLDRAKKIQEVEKRKLAAERLHNAVLSLTI